MIIIILQDRLTFFNMLQEHIEFTICTIMPKVQCNGYDKSCSWSIPIMMMLTAPGAAAPGAYAPGADAPGAAAPGA